MLRISEFRMVVRALVQLVGVLLLNAPALVSAATVEGLYTGTVRVTDSSEAARQKAYIEALGVVLTKLSGRRDAPAVAGAALNDAAKHVQRYSYVAGGRLEVGFDNAAVNALLEQLGLPLWGRERPKVLVVYPMALQGMREAQAVTEFAAQLRGLPIVWAAELSDAYPISASSIGPLQALAQRYDAAAVVVARGSSAASLNWQVVFNGTMRESIGSADEGPQLAADVLGAYYAVSGKESLKVTLDVTGIDGVDAYGNTLNLLLRNLLVRNVTVDSLNQDVVRFTLELRGTQQALERSFMLDKTLLQTGVVDSSGVLKYRYNRTADN
jgi:uncharacterized protein